MVGCGCYRNQDVCVCVCVGPRHALQTGPAWPQGSRPDMTPVRVSFHLGRRDDRDGPGLDSSALPLWLLVEMERKANAS